MKTGDHRDSAGSGPRDAARGHGLARHAWTTTDTAYLRATLAGVAKPSPPPSGGSSIGPSEVATETITAERASLYGCPKATCRLCLDGHRRAMTELETMTLYAWASGEIHLAAPPAFLTETHAGGGERDLLLDFHR